MKKLTLIRHAAAESEAPALKDLDRPLSERGRDEVPAAAARFVAEQSPLNLIIASPAIRAMETARLFATAIGFPLQSLRTDKRLYLASSAHIKAVIRETDDSVGHLAIVGHNPGISEFAAEISKDSTLPLLPTCGVITVQLPDCASWFDDPFLNW